MTKSNKIISRQQNQRKLLLEQFKKTPIVQVACEKTGIGRSTYYRWCKEDEKFRKKGEEALIQGSLLINDMAESQLITAIRDQNLTAIIFWLKHHHSAYKTRVELSGKIKTTEDPLTKEQEKTIQNALQLASLKMNQSDNE